MSQKDSQFYVLQTGSFTRHSVSVIVMVVVTAVVVNFSEFPGDVFVIGSTLKKRMEKRYKH